MSDHAADMTDSLPLVRRIHDGDSAAEDELVRMYHARVYSVLRWRTREQEAARELTDDVLMAVVCALRDGRLHDGGKLQAFVYGTARNVANNYIRARAARPAHEPLSHDIAAPDVPDGIERQEWVARLKVGMAALRRRDRDIVLRTLDGLAPREIAARLGLSTEVVRARKSRAMHRLIVSLRRGDA